MKKPIVILILISLLIFSTACLEAINAQSQSVSAIQLVGTINLQATGTMAYNPDRGEMWMAYSVPYTTELGMHVSKSNSIAIVSDINHSIVATVAVGDTPTKIAYDSEKNLMFVANSGSHTVSVVSAITYKVLTTIDFRNPDYKGLNAFSGIVYNPGNGEILVLDYFTGNITVISDSTLQIIKTSALGNDPYPSGMVHDAAKGVIFVGYTQKYKDAKPANFISVLDDRSFEVIATIPLSSNGGAAAFDSGKGELYIATANNTVSVISDKTYSIVATVSIPVGKYPMSLEYDSAKGVVFTANYHDNSTSIISDSTHTVIGTVPLGTSPLTIKYNPGKGELYLTNSGSNPLILSDASMQDSPANTPTSSPTAEPSVLEFSWLAVLPLFVSILFIIIKHKSTSNSVFNKN
jgi:YVTN family beta-propeller protein